MELQQGSKHMPPDPCVNRNTFVSPFNARSEQGTGVPRGEAGAASGATTPATAAKAKPSARYSKMPASQCYSKTPASPRYSKTVQPDMLSLSIAISTLAKFALFDVIGFFQARAHVCAYIRTCTQC